MPGCGDFCQPRLSQLMADEGWQIKMGAVAARDLGKKAGVLLIGRDEFAFELLSHLI